MEHEEGRRYIKNIEKAIEDCKRGVISALEKFKENAIGYINLLDHHIWKEDNILFRLADEHIPLSKQEEMLHKFEELEEKEIRGEHERHLNMLKILEETYLRK